MKSSRRVVRNISSTLITQVVSWVVTLLMWSYVARYLGSVGQGKISVAVSYGVLFSCIYAFVSSYVLVRDIARDPERLPALVCAAMAVRIPAALITIALGCAIAYGFHDLLSFSNEVIVFVGICLISNALAQANDVLVCALRGVEEFPKVNSALMAERVLSSVLSLAVIFLHKPILWYAAVMLVTPLIQIVMNVYFVRPYWIERPKVTRHSVNALVKQSVPFISTSLFMTMYSQTDPMYLHILCPYQVVGWYSIPSRLIGTCLALPVAVAGATLPPLSRLYVEDINKFSRFVRQLIGIMYIAVVPFACVMIFAPMAIFRFMAFPHDYDGAAPAVTVTGFTIILWFLSQIAGTALIASDRQKVLSRATGIAASISVPSCIGFVWLFQHTFANGAIGATISDAAVELTMLRSYIKALPRDCTSGLKFGSMARAIVAAAPIVIPLYFLHLGRLTLLATIPGLALYLPLCISLKAVSKDEIDQLVGLIRGNRSADIENGKVEVLEGRDVDTVVHGMLHVEPDSEPVDDLQLSLELEWDKMADVQGWHRPGFPDVIEAQILSSEESAITYGEEVVQHT